MCKIREDLPLSLLSFGFLGAIIVQCLIPFRLGYGTPNLITAYGKIVCIVYTSIGLILALLFQQILHRRLVPVLFEMIFRLSLCPRIVASSSKRRSYLLSFLLVTFLLTFVFLILPSLILRQTYVPQWSLIELTYFAVTTNQMIGLGDLMPCSDLQGQSRSSCTMIVTGKSFCLSSRSSFEYARLFVQSMWSFKF